MDADTAEYIRPAIRASPLLRMAGNKGRLPAAAVNNQIHWAGLLQQTASETQHVPDNSELLDKNNV